MNLDIPQGQRSDDGLSVTADNGDRYYELPSQPGRRFPSITTIISAGNPSKFASVDRREVALAAMHDTTWRSLPDKEAQRWLTQAHTRFLTGRAMLGSQVHQYLEDRLNGVRPGVPLDPHPEYHLRTEAVDRFMEEWDPAPLAVEAAVFNKTHGYAGRVDAILELAGYGIAIVDAKTSADLWPSVDQQLAAGANAELMISTDGVERPMIPVDTTFGLLLHEGGVYHMGEIPLRPHNFDQFLRAKATMEWHQGRPDPVRQTARIALVPRAEALERRLARLAEHDDAKAALLRLWPEGVPTPRAARESGQTLEPSNILKLARLASLVEADHGTRVSGETLRSRLTALPPDLLAQVEVTAKANHVPAINSDQFRTWHLGCVTDWLEAAELIHAERTMAIAKMVDVAECDATPEQMVGWVTDRPSASIDRLQELEADMLVKILSAIADGYLSDHPDGLVCQIDNPDELLEPWGKRAALAEARRVAKAWGLPSPRSSTAALDTPIFVAALAAK